MRVPEGPDLGACEADTGGSGVAGRGLTWLNR